MSTTPFRVGLTGGIGSGKTEVANRFAALGVTIIDADHIAHELTAPKRPPPWRSGTISATSMSIRMENSPPLLRELVFANPQKREELEAILHPLIRQQISQAVSESPGPTASSPSPSLAEGGGNQRPRPCSRCQC
jgi:dephospho-CoA kinase